MVLLNECTNFDYVIFAIIGVSALFGFFRGFLYSFIYFFGWVISALIVAMFYPDLLVYIKKHISNVNLAKLAASFGFYIVVLIIVTLLNMQLVNLTAVIRGGVLDRGFGLVFGFIRGIVISCVIFFLSVTATTAVMSKEKPAWLYKSYMFDYLEHWTKHLLLAFSSEIDEKEFIGVLNGEKISNIIGEHSKEDLIGSVEEELKQYEEKLLGSDK